jgi:hypothetical protein
MITAESAASGPFIFIISILAVNIWQKDIKVIIHSTENILRMYDMENILIISDAMIDNNYSNSAWIVIDTWSIY